MNQPEPNKNNVNTDALTQAKAKPEPIENWENEGGHVIPTGSLPKVIFPHNQEEKQESNRGEEVADNLPDQFACLRQHQ